MIELKIDTQEIRRLQALLKDAPLALKKAQSYALKRAGNVLSTEMSRQVVSQYTVNRGKFRRAMSLKQEANSVRLIVRGGPVSLKEYNLRPKKTPHKRMPYGYLSYEIRRGVVKTSEHGFLRGYRMNKPYERIGRGKMDLKPLLGPAYPQLADNIKVTEPLMEKAKEQYIQQLRYHTYKALGVIK